jgi:diketogulonate reductase-like aldo/keto reductase
MFSVLGATLALVAEAGLDMPTRQIAPGVHMPMSGIGTWLYNSTVAEEAVASALAYGTRSIDTAQTYGNQDGVGAAMQKSGVPRKEIFLTTKVDGGQGENGTVAAHEENLKLLQTAYVDLLLAHFPCDWDAKFCNKEERQATWRGLERLHKAGKARSIGVSHYCQQHIRDILEIATVPIALNQQEWHVGMGVDPEGVRTFCDAHNITFQSFSPLCGPCGTSELINGELVTGIGAAHNKTGSQVSLKWLVENGSPVISKTNNPKHLALNMDLFGWQLTEEELKKLGAATSPASVETVADDCKLTLDVTV